MTAISPTTPEGLGGAAYPPPFQMTRHVLSFLKWRFSTLPAGSYQWKPETEDSPDQTGSEVYLGAETPIRPEVVGQRPAITVGRSQAVFQGTGLGDMGHVDLATGAIMKMDVIPTNLVINVLSRLPVEAEKLAWFVVEQIWAYREAIIRNEPTHCILYLGQRPALSPPTPAGSLVADSVDFSWCAVVVTFPVFLQHSVSLMPLGRTVVRGIELSAAQTPPRTTTSPSGTGTVTNVPLQGTAVQQPLQSQADRNAAGDPRLPQHTPDEAQSSEPLTVSITLK